MKIKDLIKRLQELDSLYDFDAEVALEIELHSHHREENRRNIISIEHVELTASQVVITGNISGDFLW